MTAQIINMNSLTELPAAAQVLAAAIGQAGATVVAFEGEMGAGKTTLIRALGAALGVVDEVSSPTFSLVNEYRDGRGRPIYHFDFYRLETEDEARRIGAEEYFDSGYLCLIEWPARVAGLLPPGVLRVELTVTGLASRQLVISKQPGVYEQDRASN